MEVSEGRELDNCSLMDLIRQSRVTIKEEDAGNPSPGGTGDDAKDKKGGAGLQARKGDNGVDCG